MNSPAESPFLLVTSDDGGIRPAGPPDTCFYCDRKVGQEHELECVSIRKRIEMRVTAMFDEGPVSGLWQVEEPYAWDAAMSEFHKNAGSWCASNVLKEGDAIRWEEDGLDVWSRLRRLTNEHSCLCGRLSFEFVRVIDNTPIRLPKPRTVTVP